MERNADKNEIYERYWLICSSIGSIICHCFAFAVVCYSLTIYPVVAMSSSRETLWFYPSLFFGSSAESEDNPDQNASSDQNDVAALPAQRIAPDSPEPIENVSPARRANMSIEAGQPHSASEKVDQVLVAASPLVLLPIKKTIKPDLPEPEKLKESVLHPRPAIAYRQPSKEVAPTAVVRQRSVDTATLVDSPVSGVDGGDSHPSLKAASFHESVIVQGKADVVASNYPVSERPGKEASLTVAATKGKNNSAVPRPAAFSLIKNINKAQENTRSDIAGSGMGQRMTSAPSDKTAHDSNSVSVEESRITSNVRMSSPVFAAPVKQSAQSEVEQAQIQPIRPVPGENAEKRATGISGKAKGLFAPPITGDIKFEVVASEGLQRGVKISVGFRDYPRTKRGRPLSRSEALLLKSITPKIVTPKENAIHAIIDHASEGIYYLCLELEHRQLSDVSITIRVYEGSSRSVTKTVHLPAISGNETVVRLMMPEGIVWEDSASFSGSLQDSDSVTKFNDTGVEWKEYSR